MKQTTNILMSRIKAYLLLVLMAVLVFSLSSCGDDDDGPAPPQTVVDVAIANGYNTLAAALVTAGLDDDLRGTGPFTVFAPTDEAFAAANITAANVGSIANLEEILLYHVVSGTVRSTDLTTGTVATLNTSASLAIDADNLTVNGIAIAEPFDVEASNGIIHTIDGVLLPPSPIPDIVSLASSTSDLSTLVAALTKFPDLVATLSGSGDFTVFAPTNAAFTALLGVIGQDDLDDIPEDVLKRVLEYHVVAGTAAFSTDLSDGQMIETVLGEDVTVDLSSGVAINNANVSGADVEASNGVVHVIDAVLVPALEASIVNTVVEPAYFNKDFTTLTSAVVEAGLLNTLIDAEAEFTVFAPTNAAFEAAGITELPSAEDLVPILQYHVLGSEVLAANLPATGSAVTTLNGDFYLSINNDGVFINGTTQVVTTDIDQDNGVVHVIDRTLQPASSNVVEIAVAASQASEGAEFGLLVAALTAVEDGTDTDLITALSNEESAFTVFAPTDAAFEALFTLAGVEDLDGLVTAAGGLDVIATVLQYHVLDGRVFSTDIPNVLGDNTTATITPLAGGTWTLNSDLTIEDTDTVLGLSTVNAEIIGTDILGTNGVIHTINQVILP